MKLTVNGNEVEVTSEADTPLLWVLRDELNLVGTKFGCGIAQCGACTVHLDGVAIRSCVTPVAAVANKDIQTIEGQATETGLSPVQQAWLETDVAQCGYCQSGQIMAATALLAQTLTPATPRSILRWRAISAAAAPTRAFAKRCTLAASLMAEEQSA